MDLKEIVSGNCTDRCITEHLDQTSLLIDGPSQLYSLVRLWREQANQMVENAPIDRSRSLRFTLDGFILPQLEDEAMFFVKRRIFLDWFLGSHSRPIASC